LKYSYARILLIGHRIAGPTIKLMARKESTVKTNAARILDAAGIHYELREYTVDERDLSAPRVAEKIGMPPEQGYVMLVRSARDARSLSASAGTSEIRRH